jgi:Holliday junction resolvase RusA-like endonuclease
MLLPGKAARQGGKAAFSPRQGQDIPPAPERRTTDPWRFSFRVDGNPAPKGSMTHLGHGRMKNDNPRTKPWQLLCRLNATSAVAGLGVPRGTFPALGPVAMTLTFTLPRPEYHWKPNGQELHADAPVFPVSKRSGDLDKLTRAIFDALSVVVYFDDSQVCRLIDWKFYASENQKPGVLIAVESMGEA